MAITVTHPLDPLTADELAAAVAILRESPDVGEVRFVDVRRLAQDRDGGRELVGRKRVERVRDGDRHRASFRPPV